MNFQSTVGCRRDNVSPQLCWKGEPSGTKGFAVTVNDPDAPIGNGGWHWLVFTLPQNIHGLAEDSENPKKGLMPDGVVQTRNDFGTVGSGGACPPAGTKRHRYQFTVWALDVERLPVATDAFGAMRGINLSGHVRGKAKLTVTYGR